MPSLLDLRRLDLGRLLDLHRPDVYRLDVHWLTSHWLWLFGALSLGIVVGWLGSRLATARWTIRPAQIALAAVAVCVVLVVAALLPAHYGARLELGVVLVLVGAIGSVAGSALRDLADFMPPSTRPTVAAGATGSYLFRDALTGMGAGPAYMRATSGHGGPARAWIPPSAPIPAPARGGYTFPATRPFADATTSRPSMSTTGLRRHWTWPRPSGPSATVDPGDGAA